MREGQQGYCQAVLSCAAEIRRARGPPSKRTKVGVAAKIRRARARRARAPPARFVELQTGELERRRRDPPSSTVAASREEEGGSDRRRGGGVVVGGGAGEEGPPAWGEAAGCGEGENLFVVEEQNNRWFQRQDIYVNESRQVFDVVEIVRSELNGVFFYRRRGRPTLAPWERTFIYRNSMYC